jgi:hypothetical protein
MNSDPNESTEDLGEGDDSLIDDPFAMFSEWASVADEKAYADL